MTTVYRAGGVKSDTPTGFRVGSCFCNSASRTKLKDGAETDFVVNAGKTFYIGLITYLPLPYQNSDKYYVLMYDDDGTGTNEKDIAILPGSIVQTSGSIVATQIECCISVPANKYITVRCADAGYFVSIMINGQEV